MENRRKRIKRERGDKRACRSGKVRYADHTSAVIAMRGTQSRRDNAAVRTYHCDWCGGWHLTGKDQWKTGSGE